MSSRRPPKEEIDEFTNLDLDELQNYINNNTEYLLELKIKRNFVQQEREVINSYYEISREEFQVLEMEIENEAKSMDKLEKEHQEAINAFVNKFRHLEYDHDIFLTDTLKDNSTKATKNEDEKRAIQDSIYQQTKKVLKKNIKDYSDCNTEDIKRKKEELENKYNRTKSELEERLNGIVIKYKSDMIKLDFDLELRLKVEIHELEERKNLHINNLIKAFEDRMTSWKKENIEQIKENINLIKTNNETFKALEFENENLKKEVENLNTKITELKKQLESANLQHCDINGRLAKYYNQEINIENMNAKVLSLKIKCKETVKKTEEIEKKKEKLFLEILQLKKEFVSAVNQFRTRAEYKNEILEDHIFKLKDTYTKREIEIEELMKNVDNVAETSVQDDNKFRNSAFGRQMFVDMLENIKNVLTTKTQIIRNLKYSLALASKVFKLITII